MAIYKVNGADTATNKISAINDMVIEVDGKVAQGKFDINEIDQIYTDIGLDRKFLRNQSLGNTLLTYTGWSHLKAEDGYSIWKYTPTNYTYNALNKLYVDNKVYTNAGLATAESATTFDLVYLYDGDSGTGYNDHTTEAGTEGGTAFDLMNDETDYLYLGEASTFGGIKFEFQSRGSGHTLKIEYNDGESGDSWIELTANSNNLDDDTDGFESDGSITWDIPDDWGTSSVNGQTKYWIRISSTTEPTTIAKAYYIIPSASVIGLLALSSTEVFNEQWKWCSYSGSVYITIRNDGNTSYEGNYYITSSSSTTNLQNWFVFNHAVTADYEDSTYSGGGFSVDTVQMNTGVTPPAHNEGLFFWDDTEHTLAMYNDEAEVTQQVGREIYIRARNNSGGDIPNGSAVCISGAIGQLPTIVLAQADSAATACVVGLATHTIENNTNGYVTIIGTVNDVDTSESGWSEGDSLYLSATEAGALVNVSPTYPNYAIKVGNLLYSHGTNGKIEVGVGIVPSNHVTLNTLGIVDYADFTKLRFNEQSSDPSDPAEGTSVMWQSDGTGSGDDGDIMMKITAGAVTKTITLVDFSAS